MKQYDVMVVGGGMVGAAVALGYCQQGAQVAVVEPHMPVPFSAEQPPDLRVSAVNMASVQLLSQLGAWPLVEAMRCHPYQTLSVWETPEALLSFDAADIHEPQLGYMVENRLIQLALHQALAKFTRVDWYAEFKADPEGRDNTWLLDGQSVTAQLVVAADGANSALRQLAGIGVTGWQYQQQVLALSIRSEGICQKGTWQEFQATGPVAYLPLYDDYGCLIWYNQRERIQALKQLSDAELKQQAQLAFPERIGDIELLDRATFPIQRMHANRYFQDNIVLVGDAAHSINPLAGQGLNLGYQDVRALLKSVPLSDFPQLSLRLPKYQRSRKKDNLLMMSVMDALYLAFCNESKPLWLARNLALKLAQHSGMLKHQVMQYAMGKR